ncbi:MAG: hypothetical protein PHC87_01305 [Actinomycetota bacterium]|nr:hypothetical protein [Actinomycetota bacterium]
MYKCQNCGNTFKFIGTVKEEGTAYIYQKMDNKNDVDFLTWAFLTRDNDWQSSHNITRCFYCNSTKIINIEI